MNPNPIRKPRQTSLKMYVLCVHLRWRRVPMDSKNALTALVTLCHAKMAGDMRLLWSPKGCQNGGQLDVQQFSHSWA